MFLQILNRESQAKISPPNRAEKMQYRALKKAIESGRCTLVIDPDSFNKKYSPVYNVMENFVPLLVLVVLSLAILVASTVPIGLGALLLSVFGYIFFLKPWAEKMLIQRVYSLMMRNYYNFQYLWTFGEITLLLAGAKNIGCKSPLGDWKSFASLHFSDMMTMGALPKAPPLPQLPQPKPVALPEMDEAEEEGENPDDKFNFDDLDFR